MFDRPSGANRDGSYRAKQRNKQFSLFVLQTISNILSFVPRRVMILPKVNKVGMQLFDCVFYRSLMLYLSS